jgi:glutamyl-tRNA synthetase
MFHVGNARTALFNWMFATQQAGDFIWRVEDTDRQRFVSEAMDDAAESLRWLGIEPNEGPLTGGPHGPYYQSQRLDIYRQHVARLLESGDAYHCFCSAERLSELRKHRADQGSAPVYDRQCRNLQPDEVSNRLSEGQDYVIRLKLPLNDVLTVTDLLHGQITFDTQELEDVILIKSDGYPTYHFAVVVDDHLMEITHVMRADEWIPSMPYQVVLYEAFGWDQPVWVHVPMVLNPDGKGKLSKRKSVGEDGQLVTLNTQVREYRAAGYLPEAMFNFLALQGWSYSGEDDIFTREQALDRFRLEDIRPSPSAWDTEKLLWMNGAYIRQLEPEELARRLMPFLRDEGLQPDMPTLTRVAPLIQERLTTLKDARPWVESYWTYVEPDPQDLIPKKLHRAGARKVLTDAAELLAAQDPWSAEHIEESLRGLAAELDLKAGPTFQPIRVATSGSRVSPPLFESLDILGREETVRRLRAARDLLSDERFGQE